MRLTNDSNLTTGKIYQARMFYFDIYIYIYICVCGGGCVGVGVTPTPTNQPQAVASPLSQHPHPPTLLHQRSRLACLTMHTTPHPPPKRQSVIERERRGDYLGKTVQVVPHITNEIQVS